MDTTGLISELLRQPLDQFTAQRNARAKALKASGQGELATQVAALKKPSVPLWAVNQVDDAGLLDGLRKSAQALSKAQAGAASGRANAARDLRAASEDFQRQLDAAGTAAGAALRQAKHPDSEDTLRRVREIFRLAALQGGETWDRLRKHALAREPSPGDDLVEMFGAGGVPATGKRAEQEEARREAELSEKTARADQDAADRAAATAARLREEATDAAAAAKRAAERAEAAEAEARRARAQAQRSLRTADKARLS